MTYNDEPNGREYLPIEHLPTRCDISDFISYLPEHRYIFRPTGALWPKESVNSVIPHKIPNPETGRRMIPSAYLDQFQAAEQMTWAPGYPKIIENQILQDGGWIHTPGKRVFNLYQPPQPHIGNPENAIPWIAHLQRIYPDDAVHITKWLAHRVQRPYEKINHALVLGGNQGIGKDTLLDPVKYGVGPWNWAEINPRHMLGRFNSWVKSVVVRLNEARDLGEYDKFNLYETSKTYIAAPPDMLRIDEKNIKEYAAFNILGMIITSNNRIDGLYLPADDRRHYVAWSEAESRDFPESYWRDIWYWYDQGGNADVVAYLKLYDLRGFDPKEPPKKTPAFWAIVGTGEAADTGELRDVMEAFDPKTGVTVEDTARSADSLLLHELAIELRERKTRARIPHIMLRAGYIPIRNPDVKDGLWVINGRRCVIYCRQGLNYPSQIQAAIVRIKTGEALKGPRG